MSEVKVPVVLARVVDGPARVSGSTMIGADCGCDCWISPAMAEEFDRLALEIGRQEIYTTCVPHVPPLEEGGELIGITPQGEIQVTPEEYEEILLLNGGNSEDRQT